jgi:hypothetical protein
MCLNDKHLWTITAAGFAFDPLAFSEGLEFGPAPPALWIIRSTHDGAVTLALSTCRIGFGTGRVNGTSVLLELDPKVPSVQ